MSAEQIFALSIAAIVAVVFLTLQVSKHRKRIRRTLLGWLRSVLPDWLRNTQGSNRPAAGNGSIGLTAEEETKDELSRLQEVIKDRKQVAWDTDISHHLWNLYVSHFRRADARLPDLQTQDDGWYKLKILHASSRNNLNRYEFELNGASYTFVDDEEQHGWNDNTKYFNLCLYDDSEHCLIDIQMKVKVDRNGKNYSISSDGPKAFLPGDWISDFVKATLKQQSIRNREIRAQKHQERLWEIEDLKDRYGISD